MTQENLQFLQDKQRLLQQSEELVQQRDRGIRQLDDLMERTHFYLRDDQVEGLNLTPFHHLVEEHKIEINQLFQQEDQRIEQSLIELERQHNDHYTAKESTL